MTAELIHWPERVDRRWLTAFALSLGFHATLVYLGVLWALGWLGPLPGAVGAALILAAAALLPSRASSFVYAAWRKVYRLYCRVVRLYLTMISFYAVVVPAGVGRSRASLRLRCQRGTASHWLGREGRDELVTETPTGGYAHGEASERNSPWAETLMSSCRDRKMHWVYFLVPFILMLRMLESDRDAVREFDADIYTLY